MGEGNYRKAQSLPLQMTVQTVLFIQCVSLGMARRRYKTGRSQVHKLSTSYLHELSPWDSIRPIEKVLVFWTLLGFKLLRNKRSPLLSHSFTANAVLCQRTEPRPSLVGFYNLDLIIRCQFCLVFFFFERTFSDVSHSWNQRLNLVEIFKEISSILRNYYGKPHIPDWMDDLPDLVGLSYLQNSPPCVFLSRGGIYGSMQ